MQGDGFELFVSELEDGRLNMSEVFVTGVSDAERLRPKTRGDIEAKPDFFQVLPVEMFVSGDAFNYEDESKQVRLCTCGHGMLIDDEQASTGPIAVILSALQAGLSRMQGSSACSDRCRHWSNRLRQS